MGATAESGVFFGKDNTEESSEEESTYAVRGKSKALIELAVRSTGFEKLRSNIYHKDVFVTFMNLCLVYFCSSMNWQYKAYSTVVSDIFI